MSSWKKIVPILIAYLILSTFAESTTPAQESPLLGIVMGFIIFSIAFTCYFIFLREPIEKNKFIFLNFFLFFIFSSLAPISSLIGDGLVGIEPYIKFYIYQYHSAFLSLFLALAIGYVVFDTLFRELSTPTKYLLTILLVGIYFGYYFHPILKNSLFLYSTPDVVDYCLVTDGVAKLNNEGIADPTPAQVAEVVRLSAWHNGKQVGELFENTNIERISSLFPYLVGNNFVLLIYRPLWLNIIFLKVFCVIFVLLFFGYQYKKDPPQGAYIEKIVFAFLPYSSLEILHYYGYVRSIELEGYLKIHDIGLYLTFINLLFLLIFFGLRLSFITSVKGEFYEQELVSDSEHISRWRDSIDNLIIRHFLNPQTLHGRLFAPRETKSKA